MAVTFPRLNEQPLLLHHYCVTGFVSNAGDKPKLETPQFSPHQFFHSCCIHICPSYVQQIVGCLFDHCQTLCTILWHPALSLCHHHTPSSIGSKFEGEKNASCTKMKSGYKFLCEMKFLPPLPLLINLSHE